LIGLFTWFSPILNRKPGKHEAKKTEESIT